MTIRLVVTDLGGTLWAGDDAIPASTICAIDELARAGSPCWSQRLAANVRPTTSFDPPGCKATPPC